MTSEDEYRPSYLRQAVHWWGEPRISIDIPYRVYREGSPFPFKRGWTWFPRNVNHSLTIWLNNDLAAQGFSVSCHCQRHMQLEGRYQAGRLSDEEILSMIIMAGWGSYAA